MPNPVHRYTFDIYNMVGLGFMGYQPLEVI